jgi:hypothetical protein
MLEKNGEKSSIFKNGSNQENGSIFKKEPVGSR